MVTGSRQVRLAKPGTGRGGRTGAGASSRLLICRERRARCAWLVARYTGVDAALIASRDDGRRAAGPRVRAPSLGGAARLDPADAAPQPHGAARRAWGRRRHRPRGADRRSPLFSPRGRRAWARSSSIAASSFDRDAAILSILDGIDAPADVGPSRASAGRSARLSAGARGDQTKEHERSTRPGPVFFSELLPPTRPDSSASGTARPLPAPSDPGRATEYARGGPTAAKRLVFMRSGALATASPFAPPASAPRLRAARPERAHAGRSTSRRRSR
jgi:hypothetical protein